ncbi:MAG: transglutaminase-like cysteine peptidase [Alphaproteobacteria bacterium]
MRGLQCSLSIATIILAGSLAAPAAAQSLEPSQPAARRLVAAPPGFNDSCRRYQWFCTNRTTSAAPIGQTDLLELAVKINRRVNRSVSQLSDPENYGVADYWTLPANGNGDCEDFALQKYKLLLDAGADSRDLSIAVVLDRQGDNHAVLVLRHSSGDLVLDSLTRRVRPWNQTGYTYLAMQSGDDKTQWEVVMNQPRDSNILAQR